MLKTKGQDTAPLSCLAALRTQRLVRHRLQNKYSSFLAVTAICTHCYVTKLKLSKGRGVVFLLLITNQAEITQASQLLSLSLAFHTHRSDLNETCQGQLGPDQSKTLHGHAAAAHHKYSHQASPMGSMW